MNYIPDNRAVYQQLSEEKNFPLMMQAWWMECVSRDKGKSWNALIVNDDDGKIIGAMPIHIIQRRFFRAVLTPMFVSYFGIYIDYQGITDENDRKSHAEKIIAQLSEKLKAAGIDYFSGQTDKYFHDVELLRNQGFALTPQHTYVINDISEPDTLISKYHHMKARAVRKAMKNGLKCDVNGISPEEYYEIYASILSAKRKKVLFSKDFFVGLVNAAIAHEQGALFVIRDANNVIHSALFCAWDPQCAYALAYLIRPEYRNSGASALMMHEAIRSLSGKTKEFDFEGGNAPKIGASYSKFATTETPFYRFTKAYSLRGLAIKIALNFL